MKREIKFRGLRLEDNKFEFGYGLLQKINPHKEKTEICSAWIHTGALTQSQVDINTIGQYTGLKDSYGVEIYEGDLIKIITISEKNREVIFLDGAFMIKMKGKNDNIVYPVGSFKSDELEVTGNIHETKVEA